MRVSVGPVHRLVQDAEEVLRRLGELTAAGAPEALKHWRVERHGLVE